MKFKCFWLGFLLLLAMVMLGCDIFNKGEAMLVRKLDAVMLTANDLPTTMALDASSSSARPGLGAHPPIVEGFSQSWHSTRPEEHITVRYWLLRSISGAKSAAIEWQGTLASQGIYQPEPNAKDVIGDATWRIPNRASLLFVKNNVLVHVRAGNPFVSQLTLTRSVARKIEKKINTALK